MTTYTGTVNGVNSNRASFSNAGTSVTVNLVPGTAVGLAGSHSSGNDILRNINPVQGGNSNDFIHGSDRTDLTETLEGRAGFDLLDGRGDTDVARSDYAGRGVNLNLGTGIGFVTVASGSVTDPDTLLNIQGLRGSQFDGLPILNGAVQYAGTLGAVVGVGTLLNIESLRGHGRKNARILWAVMTREQGCDAQHGSAKPLAKQKPALAPVPEPAAA